MAKLKINYEISEKDLDQKEFSKIVQDLRQTYGGNCYDPTVHISAILKENSIQLFMLAKNFNYNAEAPPCLKFRWNKLGEKLKEKGLANITDNESYLCSLTRRQILSMNTWERVEDFLDKGGSNYGGGIMYLPSNLRGWIKFMEGFEDYFMEEWLE